MNKQCCIFVINVGSKEKSFTPWTKIMTEHIHTALHTKGRVIHFIATQKQFSLYISTLLVKSINTFFTLTLERARYIYNDSGYKTVIFIIMSHLLQHRCCVAFEAIRNRKAFVMKLCLDGSTSPKYKLLCFKPP